MAWTKGEQHEIEEIKETVESLERSMRGSNGEKGLVAKVDAIDDKLTTHMSSELVCPIHDVVIALYGDRREGLDAKGLIKTVAENTKFRVTIQEDMMKFKWLLVSAIIGGFGNLVFGVVKLVIERSG